MASGIAEAIEHALTLVGDALPLDAARAVVAVFDENGDVQVHAVDESAAEKFLGALVSDGIKGATVAAADLAASMSAGSGEYPAAPIDSPMQGAVQ